MGKMNYGEHNIVMCIKDYFLDCYDGDEPVYEKNQWYLVDKINDRYKIYRKINNKIFTEKEFKIYFAF